MQLRRLVLGAAVVWLSLTGTAPAQILTENFDDITTLVPGGWFVQNNSTAPQGSNIFQGNPTVFTAQAGATNAYVGMNFQASTGTLGTETLSVWLLTPVIPLDNGAVVSFWSRTVTTVQFPDRLRVSYSTAGSSTNVGSTPTSVGDFTNPLLDINPTYTLTGYPNAWTNFSPSVPVQPLGTTGRIAFQYFVENGGPQGANSDYIGIDTLVITPVPEPTSLALAGAVTVGGYFWRRRKQQSPA